jgi:hypothetical protein
VRPGVKLFCGELREFCEGARAQSGLLLATQYVILTRSNMNCFPRGGLSRQPLFSQPFFVGLSRANFLATRRLSATRQWQRAGRAIKSSCDECRGDAGRWALWVFHRLPGKSARCSWTGRRPIVGAL